ELRQWVVVAHRRQTNVENDDGTRQLAIDEEPALYRAERERQVGADDRVATLSGGRIESARDVECDGRGAAGTHLICGSNRAGYRVARRSRSTCSQQPVDDKGFAAIDRRTVAGTINRAFAEGRNGNVSLGARIVGPRRDGFHDP